MASSDCPDCGHPKAHHVSAFCMHDGNDACPCERTFPRSRSSASRATDRRPTTLAAESRMTEKELQELVMQAIETFGLLGFHVFDSRRSNPGFPDVVAVGRNGVLYRELKTAKGKLSPMQVYWLDTLHGAGQDVGVWRPCDWPDRITRELRALCAVRTVRPQPTQAELRKKLAPRGRK